MMMDEQPRISGCRREAPRSENDKRRRRFAAIGDYSHNREISLSHLSTCELSRRARNDGNDRMSDWGNSGRSISHARMRGHALHRRDLAFVSRQRGKVSPFSRLSTRIYR